jgi:hypothetical protein
MNIAREMLSRAFALGFPVAVLDDDTDQWLPQTDIDRAWATITAMDSAMVQVNIDAQRETMLVVSDQWVGPHETCADNTPGGWLDEIWQQLMEGVNV